MGINISNLTEQKKERDSHLPALLWTTKTTMRHQHLQYLPLVHQVRENRQHGIFQYVPPSCILSQRTTLSASQVLALFCRSKGGLSANDSVYQTWQPAHEWIIYGLYSFSRRYGVSFQSVPMTPPPSSMVLDVHRFMNYNNNGAYDAPSIIHNSCWARFCQAAQKSEEGDYRNASRVRRQADTAIKNAGIYQQSYPVALASLASSQLLRDAFSSCYLNSYDTPKTCHMASKPMENHTRLGGGGKCIRMTTNHQYTPPNCEVM